MLVCSFKSVVSILQAFIQDEVDCGETVKEHWERGSFMVDWKRFYDLRSVPDAGHL
jgi:hypothetical protein